VGTGRLRVENQKGICRLLQRHPLPYSNQPDTSEKDRLVIPKMAVGTAAEMRMTVPTLRMKMKNLVVLVLSWMSTST
jgi:hypothetical protein